MQPVDEGYFQTAPLRYERTWEVPRAAADVWGELTGEHPLHWCSGAHIHWTSARPFGVGTTREVRTLGIARGQERFFIWEEGRRKAFYMASFNLLLFKAFAEDYLVEPVGDGRCRFTWRIAITPSLLGAPGRPLTDRQMNGLFRDTERYFGATRV